MKTGYPIIALWCHPRSMSTATERVMRERGDLTCFHEPFLYDYYANRAENTFAHFDPAPEQPATYDAVKKMLFEAAQTQTVFFKDMSYYVVPQIFEDTGFAHALINVFLIRDPRRSIVSYHKLDPDMRFEEIGLLAQLHHVEWFEKTTGETPIIIEAETVQDDPVKLLSALWKKIGLDAAPHAFSWSSDEMPQGWKEVAGWHGDVLSSNAIRKDTSLQTADDLFGKYVSGFPHLQDWLDAHWPAYEALKSRSMKP